MNRLTSPIVTALAVSAGLLLAACGGHGSSTADAAGNGRGSATTATASPTVAPATSAAATSPTRAGAPVFAIPPDISIHFTGFTSSDPKKQAALTDATYAAKAVLEFEAKLYTAETPNFKRFWTGGPGAEFADSIISQGRDGTVVTGVYRYYHPVVKTLSTGNLSVQYCEDQRKAYSKDARTGKVNVTKPSLGDFMSWTLLMSESPSGEWQVYDHRWMRGVKLCQVA